MLIDVLTLIVLTLTGAVVAWQAWETRKSADASAKASEAAQTSSAALKVIHSQWIEISELSCDVHGLAVREDGALKPVHLVTVSMKLTNNTDLPLTIRTVKCVINRIVGNHSWINAELSPRQFTRPSVSKMLDDPEVERFKEGKLKLLVAGWIYFFDAFGDEHQQPVGVMFQEVRENVHEQTSYTPRSLANMRQNIQRLTRDFGPLIEPEGTHRESAEE